MTMIGLRWIATRAGAVGLAAGLILGLATIPADASTVVDSGLCQGGTLNDGQAWRSYGAVTNMPDPGSPGNDPSGVGEWGYWVAPSVADMCQGVGLEQVVFSGTVHYSNWTAPGSGVFFLISWDSGYSAAGGTTFAAPPPFVATPAATAAPTTSPSAAGGAGSGGSSYGTSGYAKDKALTLVDQVSNPVVDLLKNVLPILLPFLLCLWGMSFVWRKFGMHRAGASFVMPAGPPGVKAKTPCFDTSCHCMGKGWHD